MSYCSHCGEKINYVINQKQTETIQTATPQAALGLPTYVDPETVARNMRINNGVGSLIFAVLGLALPSWISMYLEQLLFFTVFLILLALQLVF